MAMCQPVAAMCMAICTTLFSPQSSRNRAAFSRLFRKNHTSKFRALPRVNIYFDNAARIADNSLCENPHFSMQDLRPLMAGMLNHGQRFRESIFAKTFFFLPRWGLTATHKTEVPPASGLLRAPQMTGRGFARAVTGWTWRGETLV
jgi:hypothetical protein